MSWPTRVRPRRRCDRAGHDEHGARGDSDRRNRPQPRRPRRWGEPPAATPSLEGDDDRAREHEQREEEVRHHRDRVEVEQHRDAAERNLRDRPERGGERDGAHPARQSVDPPGGKPHDHGEDDADERDETIAELDRRVPTLLRIGLVAAARPVVASEPGCGQPHDGTTRDDDPQREDRNRRELDEPARGHLAPHPHLLGDSRRALAPDLHVAHRSATPEPSRMRPMR